MARGSGGAASGLGPAMEGAAAGEGGEREEGQDDARKSPETHAGVSHPRTWPVPSMTNLWVQSSRRPIGPRAWSRSVLIPISAP